MAGVLERLGYTIDFPEDQTCCGQPAFNTGYRREACQRRQGLAKLLPPVTEILRGSLVELCDLWQSGTRLPARPDRSRSP